jgi:hypothetical protein
VTATEPFTVAPDAGAVTDTAGAVVSPGTTPDAWADGVLVLAAASSAITL